MKDKLKILIISDLHAIVDKGQEEDSLFFVENGSSEYADAFLGYVKKLKLEIDVLVCAGDIANKSCEEGFKAGWNILNKIKDELGVEEFFCVPGNHDHESRFKPGSFGPKHKLQFQSPSFPLEEEGLCTQFWAWNWCSVAKDYYNTILLNSSAYHGYAEEHAHGRIALEVADQIVSHVNSDFFCEKPVNLLICHHHPQKMEQVEKRYDTEAMEGGQYLIDALGRTMKGGWLVIHGHKHFPEITYASGSTSEPITIISAGSLSAVIHSEIVGKTGNQFYLVNIDLEKSGRYGRAIGKFETFEWTRMNGWSHSESEHLPAAGGFGSGETPSYVANKIREMVVEDSSGFLEGGELAKALESVQYFVPNDFKKLLERLKMAGCEVIVEDGKIIQVGKVS